jgi:uncharacterized protein YraI
MGKSAFWLLILLTAITLSAGSVFAAPLPQPDEPSILVNRDGVNVRLFPAIGAEVLGYVNAGWRAPATGRSPDNEWIRIDFNGEEGWIGFPVINFFGNLESLPVADPRTIPFGGFESPRAGQTDAGSHVMGRLADSGLRVRSGPSRAYPILANAPRYTVMPLLGRTANNAWLQVNFEGTLGWVTTGYVELQGNVSILDLPINGIVANALPISDGTANDYEATLRFMLERVELAQPSLDTIRAVWTDVALGSPRDCGHYPARPTNYNIPNPILAAFNPTLDPLQTLFNDAMTNVRLAIDLWLETCGYPRPQRPGIAQANVQGALEAVNVADGQFGELRRRLNELIPPPMEIGPDQCLFSYHTAKEVLSVISLMQVVRMQFDASRNVTGFCFDATVGQTLRLELLQVAGNAVHLLALSPFDNPTNFIATGRGNPGENLLSVSPVTIPVTGRYLIIVADVDEYRTDPLASDFALLVTDITNVNIFGPSLMLDYETGEVRYVDQTTLIPTPLPGFVTTQSPTDLTTCPSLAYSCELLLTCEQAYACMQAGNFLLDADGDGVPCPTLCGAP